MGKPRSVDANNPFGYGRTKRVVILDALENTPVMHALAWRDGRNKEHTRCGRVVGPYGWKAVALPMKHAERFCKPCSRCVAMLHPG